LRAIRLKVPSHPPRDKAIEIELPWNHRPIGFLTRSLPRNAGTTTCEILARGFGLLIWGRQANYASSIPSEVILLEECGGLFID
jgi:hypothetical protein